MPTKRGKSVGPRISVPADLSSNYFNDAPLVFASPLSSPQWLSSNSKMMAQADALARMTFELNLRAVNTQAERLEREIKELVICTAQDREFRNQHERRLQELWREILTVKTHMEHVDERNGGATVDMEKCKRETSNSISQLRDELCSLKDLVGAISTQLDQLPTAEEIAREQAAPITKTTPSSTRAARPPVLRVTPRAPTRSVETRAMHRTKKDIPETQPYIPESKRPIFPPKRRINEAINSTRRWNRDHKVTSLSDAMFIANYLKQQSKRDPAIAIHIQKTLQRRVQHRRPRSRSRPESLEEFCQDMTWADVIQTAEEVLVKEEARTVAALHAEDENLR